MTTITIAIPHEDREAIFAGFHLFGISVYHCQHWPGRFLEMMTIGTEYSITFDHFLTWYDAYLKLRRTEE